MKRLALFCLACALSLAACGAPAVSTPQTLTVFAAASLTGAFGEIGQAFEASHPGTKLTFNFAGSQALRTQIEQGAPADVFASAGPADMDTLVGESLVSKSAVQALLTNRLEVVLPHDNPFGIMALEDLGKPGVKLVLAAADVPAGRYARQALEQMNSVYGAGYSSRVLLNVVSNEDSVKQVVAKVQLGEADAGIVYVSDAIAAPSLKTIEIPVSLNVVAHYLIAPVQDSHYPQLAADFVQFTLTPDAQSILAKWGFGPRQ